MEMTEQYAQLKELHQINLEEKEEQIEKIVKDNEIYVKQLKEQITTLEKHLNDSKSSGDTKA